MSSKHIASIGLEKIRFGLLQQVGHSVIKSLRIDRCNDFLTRQIIYQITGYVLGREVKEVVIDSIDVPVTWWDHFKQRFFPGWLLLRFPVKTRRINTLIKHYHTCPHLNMAPETDHLDFLKGEL